MAPWGKGRCDKIHFACKTFSSQQILAMTWLGKQVLNFISFARCDLYKNAFKSSGSWYGEFSSSHLFIDISATPDLSRKEISVTPI